MEADRDDLTLRHGYDPENANRLARDGASTSSPAFSRRKLMVCLVASASLPSASAAGFANHFGASADEPISAAIAEHFAALWAHELAVTRFGEVECSGSPEDFEIAEAAVDRAADRLAAARTALWHAPIVTESGLIELHRHFATTGDIGLYSDHAIHDFHAHLAAELERMAT